MIYSTIVYIMDNCPYTLCGCPHTFGHTAYVETDIEKKTLLHDKLRKNLSQETLLDPHLKLNFSPSDFAPNFSEVTF